MTTRWVGRPPKLPPETVRRIREWAALGQSQREVARTLGVDPKTVSNYINGKHKREVA